MHKLIHASNALHSLLLSGSPSWLHLLKKFSCCKRNLWALKLAWRLEQGLHCFTKCVLSFWGNLHEKDTEEVAELYLQVVSKSLIGQLRPWPRIPYMFAVVLLLPLLLLCLTCDLRIPTESGPRYTWKRASLRTGDASAPLLWLSTCSQINAKHRTNHISFGLREELVNVTKKVYCSRRPSCDQLCAPLLDTHGNM